MHRHCHRTLSLSAMMRLTSLSACSSCLSTSSNEYFALRSLIFTEHMTMRLSNLCKLLSALNHTITTTTTKYKSHLCSSSLHLIKATLSSKTWASSLRFVSSDLRWGRLQIQVAEFLLNFWYAKVTLEGVVWGRNKEFRVVFRGWKSCEGKTSWTIRVRFSKVVKTKEGAETRGFICGICLRNHSITF